MTALYKKPFDRLEIFLNEYQPKLKLVLKEIAVLKNSDENSKEFPEALAELYTSLTALELSADGVVKAINQFPDEIAQNNIFLLTIERDRLETSFGVPKPRTNN